MAQTFSGSAVPTIDLSVFATESPQQIPHEERLKVGQSLVETLHRFGFIKIIGHGFPKRDITEALAWTKRLFDLPLEEKMKAPHPPGPMPHRGYSSIGKEKVYSQSDVENHKKSGNVGQSLRNVSDFKVGTTHKSSPLFRSIFRSLLIAYLIPGKL